jgi:hypothetical protein
MKDSYSQLECLAKAVEEIREFVRPMSGHIAPTVKMTAAEDGRFQPAVEIVIGFSEERLTQYIAESYPQEGGKDE